jgi:hypothetical protein
LILQRLTFVVELIILNEQSRDVIGVTDRGCVKVSNRLGVSKMDDLREGFLRSDIQHGTSDFRVVLYQRGLVHLIPAPNIDKDGAMAIPVVCVHDLICTFGSGEHDKDNPSLLQTTASFGPPGALGGNTVYLFTYSELR